MDFVRVTLCVIGVCVDVCVLVLVCVGVCDCVFEIDTVTVGDTVLVTSFEGVIVGVT